MLRLMRTAWMAAVEQEMWLTEIAVLQELVRQLQIQIEVTVLRMSG